MARAPCTSSWSAASDGRPASISSTRRGRQTCASTRSATCTAGSTCCSRCMKRSSSTATEARCRLAHHPSRRLCRPRRRFQRRHRFPDPRDRPGEPGSSRLPATTMSASSISSPSRTRTGLFAHNGGARDRPFLWRPHRLSRTARASALRRNRYAKAVPEAHRAFLQGLKFSCAFGDFFFCHAGIRPGIPLDSQDPSDLIWIREVFLDFEGLHPKVDRARAYAHRANRTSAPTASMSTPARSGPACCRRSSSRAATSTSCGSPAGLDLDEAFVGQTKRAGGRLSACGELTP